MTRLYRRVGKWVDDHLLSLLLGFIGLVTVVVVLWPYSVIDIPPGHMGVRWSRFGGGTVMDKVYWEGIRVIPPWDKMYLYDIRLQRMSRTYQVLVKGSLQVQVSIDFVYRPNETYLPYIHRFVGPNYADTVLAPVVAAETRNAFANFTPERGLTEDRAIVAQSIQQTINKYLLERFNPPTRAEQDVKYIAVEGVLIKEIILPPMLAEAITAKNAARERVETYTYVLQAERREAERKAIEALGIKEFAENVGNGLTDEYLKLRTIEAMLELAKSPNSKVVVLGGTPGSLPLVLGADGQPITPSPVPSVPPPATIGKPAIPPK